MKNKNITHIEQRLSMRKPLCEALEKMADITDVLTLTKPYSLSYDEEDSVKKAHANDEMDLFLKEELSKVKGVCPQLKGFEREFPSLTFSIATGVGKTRLMAACMTYLFLEKGIKHFFVLAPNLTLYEKLKQDFGNTAYSKYAFKGISEFATSPPVVVTGQNYDQNSTLFDKDQVYINIFNISKFNSDNKISRKKKEKGLPPRMKRLNEYLGDSYFNYLSKLDDLVVLMDEAHRYHADSSRKAVNELHPILGLEMTATPEDEKGKVFKNIVYEYNLAQALADGQYVKDPTIAMRENLKSSSLTVEELERIKLADAIQFHEQTKTYLYNYSVENKLKVVKPFILVVCKNTSHAKDIAYLLENGLCEGRYKGKVLQYDSTTRAEEDNNKLFLSLESPDNNIEIVVHVNMLKEGWDVNNLYTIVPLRKADASILINQTIGRGLRLPFGGKRTGISAIDKLTVISHDNFNKIIEESKNESSILRKFSYVEYTDETLAKPVTINPAQNQLQHQLEKEAKRIEQIKEENTKKMAQGSLDAKRAISEVLPVLNTFQGIKHHSDLSKEEVKKQIIKKATEVIKSHNENQISLNGSSDLFHTENEQEAINSLDKVLTSVIETYSKYAIDIPRIIVQHEHTEAIFADFDLDVSKGFGQVAFDDKLMRLGLISNDIEHLNADYISMFGSPEETIIMRLIDFPEISYDDNFELLHKLTSQVIDHFRQRQFNDKTIRNVVSHYKDMIAENIYLQMKQHYEIKTVGYQKPKVLPFVEILDPNIGSDPQYGKLDFRESVAKGVVTKYIFTGFLKCYHLENKFDSSTEADFAYVLEMSEDVISWLRPAPKQFRIYWSNNAKMYEPDFIVETPDLIYMVETKARKNLYDIDVQEKKKSAEEYCKYASEYNMENEGKPWKYLLLPHDVVNRTSSFKYLLGCNIE